MKIGDMTLRQIKEIRVDKCNVLLNLKTNYDTCKTCPFNGSNWCYALGDLKVMKDLGLSLEDEIKVEG